VRSTYRYRTFFWPALLILAGVVALLVNSGRISIDRVAQLFDLWPVILILIGLELVIRRSVHGRSAEILTAVIALVAIAGALVYVAVGPSPATNQTVDATAPAGDISHAALEIDVGAANITMAGSDSLNGALYRAHIQYSGSAPDVSFDKSSGELLIQQSSNGFSFFQNRRFVMNLELNQAVSWTITSNTGAASETMNLSSVHVGSVSINTGASREEISLGTPSGVVPVTVNGGALTVNVHRPSSTAAAIAVSGGAISLNADGRQTRAIGNLTFQTSNFGGAVDAYRVEVNGGACTVTLDANGAGG
jgi:hypothetical protein